MIITGGLNVYPKEVELVLDEINGVSESAVIGVPHLDFGETVVAVIVRNSSSIEPGEKEIISSAKDQLAKYKLPKRVIFVDQLPRNSMSKVQKNILRDNYKNLFS